MADTVHAHLKANKLGRFAHVPHNLTCPPPPPGSAPSDVQVGARCEVRSSESTLARRGTVRFVGEAEIGRGGVWVGVELDEPTGNGDGRLVRVLARLIPVPKARGTLPAHPSMQSSSVPRRSQSAISLRKTSSVLMTKFNEHDTCIFDGVVDVCLE